MVPLTTVRRHGAHAASRAVNSTRPRHVDGFRVATWPWKAISSKVSTVGPDPPLESAGPCISGSDLQGGSRTSAGKDRTPGTGPRPLCVGSGPPSAGSLRPLAYVMGSRPHGSIGSLPERGAEVYMVWSGHVSALDPRLALIKARVLFVPESQDPTEGGSDPTQRGPGPVPGVRSVPANVLDPARRSGLYMQGSGTFQPWRIFPSLAMWRPQSHPCGGVEYCLPRD
jgi:hypothetical protein